MSEELILVPEVQARRALRDVPPDQLTEKLLAEIEARYPGGLALRLST